MYAIIIITSAALRLKINYTCIIYPPLYNYEATMEGPAEGPDRERFEPVQSSLSALQGQCSNQSTTVFHCCLPCPHVQVGVTYADKQSDAYKIDKLQTNQLLLHSISDLANISQYRPSGMKSFKAACS